MRRKALEAGEGEGGVPPSYVSLGSDFALDMNALYVVGKGENAGA